MILRLSETDFRQAKPWYMSGCNPSRSLTAASFAMTIFVALSQNPRTCRLPSSRERGQTREVRLAREAWARSCSTSKWSSCRIRRRIFCHPKEGRWWCCYTPKSTTTGLPNRPRSTEQWSLPPNSTYPPAPDTCPHQAPDQTAFLSDPRTPSETTPQSEPRHDK